MHNLKFDKPLGYLPKKTDSAKLYQSQLLRSALEQLQFARQQPASG